MRCIGTYPMSLSVFGRLLVHVPGVLTSGHRPADKGPQFLGQMSYGPQSIDRLSYIRSLVHIPTVLMSSVLGPAVLRSSVHGPAGIQSWVCGPPVLKFSFLAPAVLTWVHRPSVLSEVLSPSSIHGQYHTSSCDHFLPPSVQFTVPGLPHQLALWWI